VGDESGNLPLLEFVLKELRDKRRGRILLNETYDAIGGLQGAVATKADELFKGESISKPGAKRSHYTKRQKSYANDFVDSLNNAAPAIVASASCMVEYPAAVIHIALCKLLGAPCILVLAY
jgi:hypothetical protein